MSVKKGGAYQRQKDGSLKRLEYTQKQSHHTPPDQLEKQITAEQTPPKKAEVTRGNA